MKIKRLYTLGLLLVIWAAAAGAAQGPLHDYVYTPDPNYAYNHVSTTEHEGMTVYVLQVTSQTWQPQEATPKVWQHWVTVIKPDTVEHTTALLYITGGKNTDPAPDGAPEVFTRIAKLTNSVVVTVRNVPSQPLVFQGDGKPRVEDEIIAYTFQKFMENGDARWPLLCPMVKSAVRAMDAVQDFCVKRLTPPVRINGFVLTGESKRGWTTWLTGATDPRVVAIAPQVIDVLNMRPQMAHQRKSFGNYSEEISDYSEVNLTEAFETPEGRNLLAIVDPYSYLKDLKMPKLVLLGAGDQYWPADAARLYFPDLKGPKHLRYEPNADHDQFDNEGPQLALAAFYGHVLSGTPMPEFRWKIEDNGKFLIETKQHPVAVRLWQAWSETTDFRQVTIGDGWKSTVLTPEKKKSIYKGRIMKPKAGRTAFFFELVYPSELGFNYSLSTIMTVRK